MHGFQGQAREKMSGSELPLLPLTHLFATVGAQTIFAVRVTEVMATDTAFVRTWWAPGAQLRSTYVTGIFSHRELSFHYPG